MILISMHQQQTAFENIVEKGEIFHNEQFLQFKPITLLGDVILLSIMQSKSFALEGDLYSAINHVVQVFFCIAFTLHFFNPSLQKYSFNASTTDNF